VKSSLSSRVVVIVVSAVVIAIAPVVINNHLLLVNVLTIATMIVARTINATTRMATLGITLKMLMLLIPLMSTILHSEKARKILIYSLGTRITQYDGED